RASGRRWGRSVVAAAQLNSVVRPRRALAMDDVRRRIVLDYAKWTALSALRSGAPIKSRADVYPLLDAVAFGAILRPGLPITAAEFDAWHESETLALCGRNRRVPVGWGLKLSDR